MQSDETIECPEARRGADSLLRKDGQTATIPLFGYEWEDGQTATIRSSLSVTQSDFTSSQPHKIKGISTKLKPPISVPTRSVLDQTREI